MQIYLIIISSQTNNSCLILVLSVCPSLSGVFKESKQWTFFSTRFTHGPHAESPQIPPAITGMCLYFIHGTYCIFNFQLVLSSSFNLPWLVCVCRSWLNTPLTQQRRRTCEQL